jgi:hypothetical protein
MACSVHGPRLVRHDAHVGSVVKARLDEVLSALLDDHLVGARVLAQRLRPSAKLGGCTGLASAALCRHRSSGLAGALACACFAPGARLRTVRWVRGNDSLQFARHQVYWGMEQ